MSSTVKKQSVESSNPQRLSVFGLKYLRALIAKADPVDMGALTKKYHYIVLYTYSPLTMNNFNEKTQTIILIDLLQKREDIFKKFKKNTRNEIRKTENLHGLSFAVPEERVDESYTFYKKIKRADGVMPDLKREFSGCLFFNAYYNDELITSVSCYDTGTILRLKHVVSVRKKKGFESKIVGHATRRLIWELCLYGKKRGFHTLDLAGADFSDPTKKTIANFKNSFGGTITEGYIYRYETLIFRIFKKVVHIAGMNIH